MLKRRIKFPLVMKNECNVRTMEELIDNLDIKRLVEYYYNGKLIVWLEDRFYHETSDKIKTINSDNMIVVAQKLARIFEVDLKEEVLQELHQMIALNDRKQKIKELCNDYQKVEEIINNTVFTQEEFEEKIRCLEPIDIIYLIDNEFLISDSLKNVNLECIGDVKVKLVSKDILNLRTNNIKLTGAKIYSEVPIKLIADKNFIESNEIDSKIKVVNGYENLKHVEVFNVYTDIQKMMLLKDDILFQQRFRDTSFKFVNSNKTIKETSRDIVRIPNGDLLYIYQSDLLMMKYDTGKLEKVVESFTKGFVRANVLLNVFENQLYALHEQNSEYDIYIYDINTFKQLQHINRKKVRDEFLGSSYWQFINGKYYVERNCSLYTIEDDRYICNFNYHFDIICRDKIIKRNEKNSSLIIYDLESGNYIETIKAHDLRYDDSFTLLKKFDDVLVTMTLKGEVKIWDSEQLSVLKCVQIPDDNRLSYYGNDVDLMFDELIVLYNGRIHKYKVK